MGKRVDTMYRKGKNSIFTNADEIFHPFFSNEFLQNTFLTYLFKKYIKPTLNLIHLRILQLLQLNL